MSDWNPALYRQFEDERTRPARELLARVPLATPARVVDLGCGPGNSTELLLTRFPGAQVTGTDTSPAMLAEARLRVPGAHFERSDIATWMPGGDVLQQVPGEGSGGGAPDVLFANASLQWVGDHAALIPRLFGALAPWGVLAVQMPDNLDEPAHQLTREVARLPTFAHALGRATPARARLLSEAQYYDALAPQATRVDIWRTVYQHPMESAAAIVQWMQGTGLRPFLAPLNERQRAVFLQAYEERVDAAYPARRDGRRLLAFPRLFIVAQRKS